MEPILFAFLFYTWIFLEKYKRGEVYRRLGWPRLSLRICILEKRRKNKIKKCVVLEALLQNEHFILDREYSPQEKHQRAVTAREHAVSLSLRAFLSKPNQYIGLAERYVSV